MSEHQQRVEEFMKKAGQKVGGFPETPPEDIRRLRARLILEEAFETIDALGFEPVVMRDCSNESVFTILDRVTNCAVHVTLEPTKPSLPRIADGCADLSVVTIGTLSACGITDAPLLKEVDEANLRKFGPGARRRPDGKWLKPPDFIGPDIEGVLKRLGWTG